jgi:hypothetical protein
MYYIDEREKITNKKNKSKRLHQSLFIGRHPLTTNK